MRCRFTCRFGVPCPMSPRVSPRVATTSRGRCLPRPRPCRRCDNKATVAHRVAAGGLVQAPEATRAETRSKENQYPATEGRGQPRGPLVKIICESCHQPIGAAGAVYVDFDEVEANEAYQQSRAVVRATGSVANRARRPSQLMDEAPAPWHRRCNACYSDGRHYLIEGRRIRTFRDVVAWSAHLAEKEWFACTDWSEFCYGGGVLEGRGTP